MTQSTKRYMLPNDDALGEAGVGRLVLLRTDEPRVFIECLNGNVLAEVNKEIVRRKLTGDMPECTLIEFYCVGNEGVPDLVWAYDLQTIVDHRGVRASDNRDGYEHEFEWTF